VVVSIGGGFSGAALCWQLLALGGASPRIVLIDKSGKFGPGLAYGGAHPSHLLNVRAGNMSIDPARPNDFVDWLRASGHEDVDADTFAPRVAFGGYVETRLRGAMRTRRADQLTLVCEEAIACRPQQRGVAVQLASGVVIEADAVVLALGNAPPMIPAPFDAFGADVIVHRHRTPGHVVAWLNALEAADVMGMIAGRVREVVRTADGFTIGYALRGSGDPRRFAVKRIVNCTGACADVSAIEAPLMKQMLSEGVVREHPTGLGLNVDDSGHVLGANGVARATILALGPLTQGAHWESTSAPDIRTRATAMISEIARVEARNRRAILGAFGNVTALSARRRATSNVTKT
jgi:uncharacterized NAD(P)/FAD-binding protein YdhS